MAYFSPSLLAWFSTVVNSDGITDVLGALAPHLRRTLTWDQGKELSLHRQINARTGTRVFFCDAHSPWQRGSNENMNGLLRDYFPKGIDLATILPQELAASRRRNQRTAAQNSRLGPTGGPDH